MISVTGIKFGIAKGLNKRFNGELGLNSGQLQQAIDHLREGRMNDDDRAAIEDLIRFCRDLMGFGSGHIVVLSSEEDNSLRLSFDAFTHLRVPGTPRFRWEDDFDHRPRHRWFGLLFYSLASVPA